MAVLDAKKTYKALKKKGFIDALYKSDDHKYLEFYHNDKLILYTKISHGEKDLTNFLIKQMSEQCKVSKQDFFGLVNCLLSEEQYIELLAEQGIIE